MVANHNLYLDVIVPLSTKGKSERWSNDFAPFGAMETPHRGNVSARKCLKKHTHKTNSM